MIRKLGIGFLYIVAAAYFGSLLVAFLVAYRANIDWLIVLGAFWLGAFLGTLLGFYVHEAEEWGPRALAVSIWVVAGSSILVLLQFLSPSTGVREVWFYPIGIVGGYIIATVWEYVDPPLPA